MKHRFFKIIIVCSIAGVCFLASCHKSGQPSTPYTQMEGKWLLVQTATDDNNNGLLDRGELINVPSNNITYLSFNKDLTGTENITYNDTVTNYSFTWNLSNGDSDLIRIEEGDSIVSHIDEINNTDLTLKNNTTPVASWELYRKQ